MKTKWFRAKRYGWGWIPATWQGWGIFLAYLCTVVAYFLSIDSHSHSVSDTLINYIPVLCVLSLFLAFIMYKTGEKPGWRWGTPKKKSSKKKKK